MPSLILTAEQLAASTGAFLANAQKWLIPITDALGQYDVDTPERVAMALANIGHESMRLTRTTEIWGPTPAQRGYEGRADLGNVQPGDGARFKGRGLLQTTGRANYARLRDRLRARMGPTVPDFEAVPDLLAAVPWAALGAADYIGMRSLNARADRGDFEGYCAGINGRNRATGKPNGMAERLELYDNARRALGI